MISSGLCFLLGIQCPFRGPDYHSPWATQRGADHWFVDLSEADQDAIDFTVDLLIGQGPNLRFPHSSGISNSRHSHMRELRVQSEGRPIRIFYAFDPRRSAILLIGGDKTGDDRFYERMIPIADELYDVHLKELTKEGLLE